MSETEGKIEIEIEQATHSGNGTGNGEESGEVRIAGGRVLLGLIERAGPLAQAFLDVAQGSPHGEILAAALMVACQVQVSAKGGSRPIDAEALCRTARAFVEIRDAGLRVSSTRTP